MPRPSLKIELKSTEVFAMKLGNAASEVCVRVNKAAST